MKFVMNERVKHRLTGLIVILSIAAIFVPAVVKKSNQRFEESLKLSVHLPAKPMAPKVAIPEKKAMFNTVKVAHVKLPTVIEAPRATQLVKAEPIRPKPVADKSVVVEKPVVSKPMAVVKPKEHKQQLTKVEQVVVPAVRRAAASPKKLVKSFVSAKEIYAVQLASFTQQSNAESLVTRLRNQGYKATYNKFSGRQGNYYKVTVGQLNQKDQAKQLQKKLAANMQLSGFVVKAGVS